MGRFEPVVIEREGGHYLLRQGAERLLRVPLDVFEGYEGDAVFPPSWTARGGNRSLPETRYMLWHPPSGEFLMSPIRPRPPLLAEVYGSHPFRSYLQAFWFPECSRLILRTYWNPASPAEPFDTAARKINYEVQSAFARLALRLMPPPHATITLNAVDRYQRIIGLDGSGAQADPTLVTRLHLSPLAKLTEGRVENALFSLSVEMAGRAYPTIDGERFRWVETLTESDMREVRGVLDANGVQYSDSEFRSH